jgi:Flp pilus assembly protein TadG
MQTSSQHPERGAVLLHIAIGIVVLIGFNAFVVDYGIMWVGRRQAQNAADAGALAGAVAMAFDANGWTDRTPTGPARAAAHQMALSNAIWGQAPNVNIDTDVYFTGTPAAMCPPDAGGLTPCIRVDVYRNQLRGNPLPAIFGRAVGLTVQGVRATATARFAVADASDCMKPWAIPDKWVDNYDVTAPVENPAAWTADDTFESQTRQGNDWIPLPNPDVYVAPSSTDPGTGFTVAADLGTALVLKTGSPHDSIAPGVFYPVQIPRWDGAAQGGADYEESIATCNGVPVRIGDVLQAEAGNMIGPTAHGVEDLIALDPDADWDPVTKSVTGGCVDAGTCGHSPRIVAIPVFDTSVYYATQLNGGQAAFTVVNILGFFIDDMQGNDVVGYLTEAPGLALSAAAIDPRSSFVRQIQLIR